MGGIASNSFLLPGPRWGRVRSVTVIGATGDGERERVALVAQRVGCLAREVSLLGTVGEGAWRGGFAEFLARWRVFWEEVQRMTPADWRSADLRSLMHEALTFDAELDMWLAEYERATGRESQCPTAEEQSARVIAERNRRDAQRAAPFSDIARAGMWIGGGIFAAVALYAVVTVAQATTAVAEVAK